jgi:hypothetical protein
MPDLEVREQLDALIRQSGIGYAEVSRLIGRNAAYVQQFIKRGVPRRLGEQERRLLAAHFDVPESLLGGPAQHRVRVTPDSADHQLFDVPFLCGSTAAPGRGHLRIDGALLGSVAGQRAKSLAALVVEGDAMAPTLLAGDQLLIDLSDKAPPRDGLYVIESESNPQVKRLSVNPANQRVAVLSDNAAYRSFADCPPDAIGILGRVVWISRPIS